jgi:hypothetical protein
VDLITLAVTVALTTEITLTAYATMRIVQWHLPVRGQAKFLDRLVARDVRVTAAGLAIGALVIYSLMRFALPGLGLPAILPPWGSALIGIVLAVLLWGPIDDWLTIRRERKE